MKTSISSVFPYTENEITCSRMIMGWNFEVEKSCVPESEGEFVVRLRFYRNRIEATRGLNTRIFKRKQRHTFTINILMDPEDLPEVEAVRVAKELTQLILERTSAKWRPEIEGVLERFRLDPGRYELETVYLDDESDDALE